MLHGVFAPGCAHACGRFPRKPLCWRCSFTRPAPQELYRLFKKTFSQLPLAAVVNGKTLVVHGGMWRKPGGGRLAERKARNKRKRSRPAKLDDEGTCAAAAARMARRPPPSEPHNAPSMLRHLACTVPIIGHKTPCVLG